MGQLCNLIKNREVLGSCCNHMKNDAILELLSQNLLTDVLCDPVRDGEDRQSIPVLGNLGPVLDWRSNFGDPGIVRTCNEDLYWLASTRKFWNCNGLDWWPFEDLPHPCLRDYITARI